MLSNWLLKTITELWQDTTGRIFILTIVPYFWGYAIYSGYFARFTGGWGSLLLNLREFSLIDLFTFFPTAILTIFNIIARTWKPILFGALMRLVIPIIVSSLIAIKVRAEFSFQINFIDSVFLVQASLIIWLIGLNIPFFSHSKSEWEQRLIIASWLFLQILGLSLFFTLILSVQNIPENNLPTNPADAKTYTKLFDVLFILLSIIDGIFILILFGKEIADTAIKERALSKVIKLNLNYPIDVLAKFSDPLEYLSKQTIEKRTHWLFKPELSLSINPNIYTYSPKIPVYLVATFHLFIAFFIYDETQDEGEMLLISNNAVLALEFAPTYSKKNPSKH